jgi:cell division protein FtsL
MNGPAAGLPATVVDAGAGGGRASLALIGLLVLGLTLGALVHVAVHAKRIEVALALGNEERQYRELAEQRRHLEIEIGMLKDPGRIVRIARDELHMAPPTPEDIKLVGAAVAPKAAR